MPFKAIYKLFFLRTFRRGGYTTLEILVVISVTTMLTGIMILYSRTSENQIALVKEQAKVVNAFVRAKALAAETFAENDPKPCAYGLFLDGRNFIIFRDLPDPAAPEDCNSANKQYDSLNQEELFDSFVLDEHINIQGSATTFSEVIFIPPDPSTIINLDPGTDGAQLVLQTIDGSASSGIKINSAGQVTSFRPQ